MVIQIKRLIHLLILFYFIEEFDCQNMIRNRQIFLEIKVPSDCVRSIIGPGGANIKEVSGLSIKNDVKLIPKFIVFIFEKIQQKTECRINFKDKNATHNKDDGNDMVEKTLLIRGSSANAQKAELEIKRLILDNAMPLTEEYLVPDFACGRIIGKGGQNIREIQVISNCRIKLTDKIYNRDSKQLAELDDRLAALNESKKKITISGTTEQILCAKVFKKNILFSLI